MAVARLDGCKLPLRTGITACKTDCGLHRGGLKDLWRSHQMACRQLNRGQHGSPRSHRWTGTAPDQERGVCSPHSVQSHIIERTQRSDCLTGKVLLVSRWGHGPSQHASGHQGPKMMIRLSTTDIDNSVADVALT